MKKQNQALGECIGIMADSHGDPQSIASALTFFGSMNCRPIFHLGDICDSAHPETAADCVNLLISNSVKAIRGNNDQLVVANMRDRYAAFMPSSTFQYLNSLPLIEHYKEAVFTHSLPFVQELGLACMVGALGKIETQRIFKQHPNAIVFRGHSHSPEILWPTGGAIDSREIVAGEKIDLTRRIPCIINCGALSRWLCMVWQPQQRTVACYSL